MPYTSRAQQRAMYAAASGHSTLGIPKKVGAEFVKAGPASDKLPEHVKKAYKQGRIKTKHLKKMADRNG